MRLFISADMEGISGVERVHEITPGRSPYDVFCRVMAGDVNAVVAGCFEAGAQEVVVADGHARMTNLVPADLDPRVRLKSGPSKHVQFKGISEEFDAVMFVGYHSRSGTQGILSHTYVSSFLDVRLDGISVGEAGLNTRFLRGLGLPVIFMSGDNVATEEARPQLGAITFVQTKKALGRTSAQHLALGESRQRLKVGAIEALKQPIPPSHPDDSDVSIDIDLSVDSSTSIPPGVLARNRRFLDDAEDVELNDFEFVLRTGEVDAVAEGTVRLHGPIRDVYPGVGRLATLLMDRNLDWLYREVTAAPYDRDLSEFTGVLPCEQSAQHRP